MIDMYCSVKGNTESVLPSHSDNGRNMRNPATQMPKPASSAYTNPVAAIVSALSCRLAPNSRDIKLPLPCPKNEPTAWMIHINEKTIPTAAVDCVLSCPTK